MEKAGGKTSRHGVSESGVFQDTVTKATELTQRAILKSNERRRSLFHSFHTSTNSGQISAKSSGRKSRRVTTPPVALSIRTHQITGGVRWPFAQRKTSGAWALIFLAKAAAEILSEWKYSLSFIKFLS
nr:MAG TPA: hypothetical protein [Caudoviricetes sp.]